MTKTERDKFILDNLNLIYYTIDKMGVRYLEDELYDLLLIALIKGVDNYDPSISKPSTFLCKYLSTEVLKYFKTQSMKKRKAVVVSLNTIVNDNDGTELIDLQEDKPAQFDSNIIAEDIEQKILRYLATLPEYKEEIYKRYLGIGGCRQMKVKEIAKEYQLTESNIHFIINKINNAMYVVLKDYI